MRISFEIPKITEIPKASWKALVSTKRKISKKFHDRETDLLKCNPNRFVWKRGCPSLWIEVDDRLIYIYREGFAWNVKQHPGIGVEIMTRCDEDSLSYGKLINIDSCRSVDYVPPKDLKDIEEAEWREASQATIPNDEPHEDSKNAVPYESSI